MSGDSYKRRAVDSVGYQCGCKWVLLAGAGDVLVECPLHKQATQASVDKFERETFGARQHHQGKGRP